MIFGNFYIMLMLIIYRFIQIKLKINKLKILFSEKWKEKFNEKY